MADYGFNRASTNWFPRPRTSHPRESLFCGAAGLRLKGAIERVYDAFAESHLEQPLRYCPHCYTAADAEYLIATPLRDLSFDDAAYILTSSPLTLGTKSDLNYFLPRLLEALAYQAQYLPHVLPDRFKVARSVGWSDSQVAAVVEFVKAYVAAVNEAEDNFGLFFDLEEMLPAMKEVLPELPADLVVWINES